MKEQGNISRPSRPSFCHGWISMVVVVVVVVVVGITGRMIGGGEKYTIEFIR